MAVAAHYAARGISIARLDLRQPSLSHLRLSAMLATVERALGGPADRAVVFGSSLGGLTACRVAERDARVGALVLLAPAFRLIERWRARLGDAGWNDWQRTGWLEVHDHAEKRPTRVHFGFAEEAAVLERGPLPDVRVPTLVVHGVRDDVVDIETSREWSRGKRHVRLVEVDDGHELVASIPRILEEADRFLSTWTGP
jgi:hypothetical protein